MKKFLVLALSLALTLSALCVPVFADENPADPSDGYTEMGTFSVLASQCNRGMVYTDVYFGTADPPACVCGDFRIYEGECEVVSDGSPEGEAALEYYTETGLIPAGTAATIYFAAGASLPDDPDDEIPAATETYISLSSVKKIALGAPTELTEEACELMFRVLNEARNFEWDALIQCRYSLDDGKLSSEIYTLQPEEYMPCVDNLTVLSCEHRDDGSARIVLQGTDENGRYFGHIVELADAGNIATPDDGTPEGKAKGELYRSSYSIEPGTVVKLVLFYKSSANGVHIDGDEVYGIMFYGESADISAEEIKAGLDRFKVETSAPNTGIALCILPAVLSLAAIAVTKKKK